MREEQEGPPSTPTSQPPTAAGSTARRQLRRVLLLLALMDVSVILVVVGLAEARSALGLTTDEFLASLLGGAGLILAARVALAVRLRPRAERPS